MVKDFVQAFEAIRNAWSLEGRGREMRSLLRSARQTARNGHTISYTLLQYLCSYTLPDGVGNSLRASSPIWESEASRARTRARAGPPSPLARLLFTISPNGELARRLGWKLVDGWPAAKFPSWGLLLLSLLSFCFLVSLSCLIPSRFL